VKGPTFLLTVFALAGICHVARSESLKVLDTIVIRPIDFEVAGAENAWTDLPYIPGVCEIDSTIYLATNRGVFAKDKSVRKWRRIVSPTPQPQRREEALKLARKQGAVYQPKGIWPVGRNRLLVLDDAIQGLYTIDLLPKIIGRTKFIYLKKYPYLSGVCVRDSTIFLSRYYSEPGEPLIAVANFKGAVRNSMFPCPERLRNRFYSMQHYPDNVLAYCDSDSTIWFSFLLYNYVYRFDLTGRLKDSLLIDDPEYHVPELPISDIITDKVYADWLRKYTRITAIWSAGADVILLQFTCLPAPESANLYGIVKTIAWRSDGTPLASGIPDGFGIIGTQEDGTIFLLKDLRSDSSDVREILYIVRLESKVR